VLNVIREYISDADVNWFATVLKSLEKVGFEPGVKECGINEHCWKWWRRERWLDKCMRKWRMTRLIMMRLTKCI